MYLTPERARRVITQIQAIIVVIIILIALVGIWDLIKLSIISPIPCARAAQTSTEGKILRSTWAFPTYIDPHVGNDRSSRGAQVNLYDPLIKLGAVEKVVPYLATDWTFSEDGLTWVFNIRQGVKFHDGTELKAEDVAWSMNRFLTMGLGGAYVLTPYVEPNAETINDYIVKFHLKKPFGPFVSALNNFYVLNKDLVMKNIRGGEYGKYGDYGKEWLLTHDAGSGSYKVKSFALEEKLVMEKFDDYWNNFADRAPEIVEMLATIEAITVRTMLAKGELEYSDPWQSHENFLVIKELPGIKISGQSSVVGGAYLMINTKLPPTDDVHFRRALAWCLNYTRVTTDLFPGTIQMIGPANTAMLGHNPDILQYHQDFDKARDELALSKYADNYTEYEVELHWVTEVPDEEKVALQLMMDSAQVGINIKVVKTPWVSLVEETGMLETSPHITWVFVTGTYPEAGSLLISRYHSDNAASWQQNEWLLNETLDAALEDAIATLDFDERMEKYKKIQEVIVGLCPSIFLFQTISWNAHPEYIAPPWVTYGKYAKPAILGDVYVWRGNEFDCRLWEVRSSEIRKRYLTVKSDFGSIFNEGSYQEGSTASFSVSQTIVSGGSDVRYIFTGWVSSSPGGYTGSDNPAEVVMNNDITETAQWKKQYLLTVTSPSDLEGGGWYDEGSTATLRAVSPQGFLARQVFKGWSGDIQSESETVTIVMDDSKMVVAEWTTDYTQLYILGGVASVVVTSAGALSIQRRRAESKRRARAMLKEHLLGKIGEASEAVSISALVEEHRVSEEMIRRLIDEALKEGFLSGKFTNDGRNFITDTALKRIIRDKLRGTSIG